MWYAATMMWICGAGEATDPAGTHRATIELRSMVPMSVAVGKKKSWASKSLDAISAVGDIVGVSWVIKGFKAVKTVRTVRKLVQTRKIVHGRGAALRRAKALSGTARADFQRGGAILAVDDNDLYQTLADNVESAWEWQDVMEEAIEYIPIFGPVYSLVSNAVARINN